MTQPIQRINMRELANRAEAVRLGYIWSAPIAAVEAAMEDIKAGRIDPPDYIPDEYASIAASYGIKAAPPTDGRPVG